MEVFLYVLTAGNLLHDNISGSLFSPALGISVSVSIQTVATHELGHTIGMGDLYTLPDGDPCKSDYAQVMNSYDAPQRSLGNGDRMGVQIMYEKNTERIDCIKYLAFEQILI